MPKNEVRAALVALDDAAAMALGAGRARARK